MTDVPSLEQVSRGRDTDHQESDNGDGNGNGRGIDSGCGLAVGGFQFTFSQPSDLANACADANTSVRKIANVGKGWAQRAALNRLQGKGHEAAPMTASEDKEEQTVGGEQSLWEEICQLREDLRRKEGVVEGLERLSRSQAIELSLSTDGGRMRTGDEGEMEMSLLAEKIKELEEKLVKSEHECRALIAASAEQKATLDKTKDEVTEKDELITALEKQVGEDSKSLEQKQAALDRHQEILDNARGAEKRANERADNVTKQLESALKDAKGLIAKNKDLESSGSLTSRELDNLRVQAKIYEDAAVDIKAARDHNKALRKELTQLKEDMNTIGFNPDSKEYRKKLDALPHKTLEDELAEAASEAESDDEIEPPRPGRLGPLPVLSDIRERVVTKIVYKNVYINRTTIVDRPFQILAHNPVKCWFQVELNFFVLFYAFLASFFSIIAKISRKVSMAPTIEESAKLITSNPTSGEATPTNGPQRPPSEPADSHIPGSYPRSPSIEPTVGHQPARQPQGMSAQSTDEPQATAIDLETLRPRLWKWSTITNPNMLPPARATIIAFVCHLVVYATLFYIYGAYAERQLWLAANDSTRVYVRQLIDHPGSFRSGMAKILFMLPEEWKHVVDRVMFKTVVLGLNLKVNHVMPG